MGSYVDGSAAGLRGNLGSGSCCCCRSRAIFRRCGALFGPDFWARSAASALRILLRVATPFDLAAKTRYSDHMPLCDLWSWMVLMDSAASSGLCMRAEARDRRRKL